MNILDWYFRPTEFFMSSWRGVFLALAVAVAGIVGLLLIVSPQPPSISFSEVVLKIAAIPICITAMFQGMMGFIWGGSIKINRLAHERFDD